MPECHFFKEYGECTNPECIFLHILPEDKMKPCQWYDRGFCKHGIELCKKKHTPKVACPDYMAGFCGKGPNCKFAHPKFELPWEDDRLKDKKPKAVSAAPAQEILVEDVQYQQYPRQQQQQQFYGGSTVQMGYNNPTQQHLQVQQLMQQQQFQPQQPQMMDYSQMQQQQQQGFGMNQNNTQQKRALSEVLCFKCKQYGHYANNCPNQKRF